MSFEFFTFSIFMEGGRLVHTGSLFGPEGPTLNELADPGPRRVIASVRVALQKVVVRIDRGQQNLV